MLAWVDGADDDADDGPGADARRAATPTRRLDDLRRQDVGGRRSPVLQTGEVVARRAGPRRRATTVVDGGDERRTELQRRSAALLGDVGAETRVRDRRRFPLFVGHGARRQHLGAAGWLVAAAAAAIAVGRLELLEGLIRHGGDSQSVLKTPEFFLDTGSYLNSPSATLLRRIARMNRILVRSKK